MLFVLNNQLNLNDKWQVKDAFLSEAWPSLLYVSLRVWHGLALNPYGGFGCWVTTKATKFSRLAAGLYTNTAGSPPNSWAGSPPTHCTHTAWLSTRPIESHSGVSSGTTLPLICKYGDADRLLGLAIPVEWTGTRQLTTLCWMTVTVWSYPNHIKHNKCHPSACGGPRSKMVLHISFGRCGFFGGGGLKAHLLISMYSGVNPSKGSRS